MTDRRIEFSLSSLQTILLISGGLIILLLAFVLGIMVGKGDIMTLPSFGGEVKSRVVKMKIEPPSAPQATVHTSGNNEQSAVMNNATSKPLLTFYDTLAKPKGKEKEQPAVKAVDETKKEAKTDNSSKKLYTLQVGAMKDKGLADAMAAKLKKFGYSAYIYSSGSSGKGAWYKVRLGTFSSKEDAQREAAKIKKNEGLQATVVEK